MGSALVQHRSQTGACVVGVGLSECKQASMRGLDGREMAYERQEGKQQGGLHSSFAPALAVRTV